MMGFDKNFGILLFVAVMFLGLFTLGCTLPGSPTEGEQKQDTKKGGVTGSLGIFISDVRFDSRIEEGSSIDLSLEVSNGGEFDAKNVKIYLDGLSNRWNPPTPIERNVGNINRGDYSTVEFSTTSPVVGINVSYSFKIRVEYDYEATYFGVFEVKRDGTKVNSTIKNQMKSNTPIVFNLLDQKYESATNSLRLKFDVVNREKARNGNVIGSISIRTEDMTCDTTSITFRETDSSKTLNCYVNLPSNFDSFYPQVKLKASYRYTYSTQEYKVNVYTPK
ncbi:MAG: hypothetical protein RMJ18_01405 [Candidatus Aenigmarchaeota archaeon]|nr:hypothetical protein [Candidatus Aenigmarchaeota archaeon]MDW8160058.1 hypothetical protein [Candidatus Aenigmarchaeota archaeon]